MGAGESNALHPNSRRTFALSHQLLFKHHSRSALRYLLQGCDWPDHTCIWWKLTRQEYPVQTDWLAWRYTMVSVNDLWESVIWVNPTGPRVSSSYRFETEQSRHKYRPRSEVICLWGYQKVSSSLTTANACTAETRTHGHSFRMHVYPPARIRY